ALAPPEAGAARPGDEPGHGAALEGCSMPGESERPASREVDRAQRFGGGFHFSRPSLRTMSLMPRTAWRVRCSFSIRAKRTYSSPYSPKPMPGETATLASDSTRLENSSEPMAR